MDDLELEKLQDADRLEQLRSSINDIEEALNTITQQIVETLRQSADATSALGSRVSDLHRRLDDLSVQQTLLRERR